MLKYLHRLLRPVLLVVAAMLFGGAAYAGSSNVALLTGPQPAADLSSILNGLINSMNSAFGPTNGNSAAGGFSTSARNWAACNQAAQVSTAGTDTTPVATQVYVAEVFVPANATLTGVAVMNGSVASGNLKVGLASSNGAVVATSASTAMAGTDAYQLIPFTTTYNVVGPATYYVLEFVDNATARLNMLTFGTCGTVVQTGQVFATGFTTITPPTTFTTSVGPIANLY